MAPVCSVFGVCVLHMNGIVADGVSPRFACFPVSCFRLTTIVYTGRLRLHSRGNSGTKAPLRAHGPGIMSP